MSDTLQLLMRLERRLIRLEKLLKVVPPKEELTHPKALAQYGAVVSPIKET